MFIRKIFYSLMPRLLGQRRFIQVLSGPRQVGKTTLAKQLTQTLTLPWHYASADEPGLQDRDWLTQQWDLARHKSATTASSAVLILDEIQKLPHWSDTVKQLWDEDSFNNVPLHVVLLGSAPLLIQQGLTESLAGRFEILPMTHWSYAEMREAFDFSLEQYLYYGGYPGAASLINDEKRWRHYIVDSLIETTLSRDILLLSRVHKPALLRQLFRLSCDYSGQVLSYQKLMGQLDDAKNTTTLAHYLQLLGGAGMVKGLEKCSKQPVKTKNSSPKLQVLNTALMTAQNHLTFEQAFANKEYWGRLVETAVGAYLVNQALTLDQHVYYWRERHVEVDFVIQQGDKMIALEVKSGLRKNAGAGMQAFAQQFKPYRQLLIGGSGIPLEQFFSQESGDLFS